MPTQSTYAADAKRRQVREQLQQMHDRKIKLIRTSDANSKCVIRMPAVTRKEVS